MSRRRPILLGALMATLLVVVAATQVGHGKKAHAATQPRLHVALERDVSRTGAIESETAIAVDPSHPWNLLAGSNVVGKPWMAVYSSVDAGHSWRTGRIVGPAGVQFCGTSDPTVAIDGRGRQYYGFLGLECAGAALRSSRLYVATRASARDAWRTRRLPVTRQKRFTLADDRPFLVVDNGKSSKHRGRLYVGWTRFTIDPNIVYASPELDGELQPISVAALVTHSDDRGRHWSKPSVLSSSGKSLEVRLATASDGTLYATWREAGSGSIYVTRSDDGGRHFDPPRLAAGAFVDPRRSCGETRQRIAAQPKRCVSPNPVVSVDTSTGPRAGRVYVIWGTTSLNRSQDIAIAAFDPSLMPLLGVGEVAQVNPPEGIRGPDQFLPASTVDPKTGRLWVCYYQSYGVERRVARYACTASLSGGMSWSSPRFVASRLSNENSPRANHANGFGDYEGVATYGGLAHPVWTDGRALGRLHEEVFTARVR